MSRTNNYTFFTLQAWFGDLKLKLGAQILPSKWSSFKNAPLKMYITHAMLAKKVNPEQLIFFHHYYLFYVRKAVNWLKMLTHAQKVVLKGTIPQNVKRTSLKMSATTSCAVLKI